MIKKRLLITLLLLLPAFVNAGVVEGTKIWRTHCAQCHGADGSGSAMLRELMPDGSFNFNSPAAAISMTRKRMLLAVRDGANNGIMPAFRSTLNYQQILDVIDYARESFVLTAQTGNEHLLGKQVFADDCLVCHGDQGQGAVWAMGGLNPSPANFTSRSVQKKLARQRMIFSVTNRRPETAMVSWKKRLGDKKINAVVDYIRAAIMKIDRKDYNFGHAMGQGQNSNDPFLSANDVQPKTISSSALLSEQSSVSFTINNAPDPFLTSGAYEEQEDPNLKQSDIYNGSAHEHNAHMGKVASLADPLPQQLIGNFFTGKKLYQDNCVACHGLEGNGRGPRAYFIFPKPRNFTHSAARASFSRAHIFERITSGVPRTEMPAWGQVLNEQQIANIAEYVFVSFIKPAPSATQVPSQQ